jgi:hypothetical protein
MAPQRSERYFHNKQDHDSPTGLVQQTVQIVARFAITI